LRAQLRIKQGVGIREYRVGIKDAAGEVAVVRAEDAV